MILGLVQMRIAWEAKQTNKETVTDCVKRFSAWCADFAPKQADGNGTLPLLVFPEMTMSGFSMNTELTADASGETTDFCRRLAEEYGLIIGIGCAVKKQDTALCENRFMLVAPSGVILDYTKLHPFTYAGEHTHFQSGNHLSVRTLGDFTVGAAICYDLRFPELFRRLADEAQLVLVPANWPTPRTNHWDTLLAARAIENQYYVAGVNCVGEAGGQCYDGHTALFAPDGTKKEPVALVEIANPPYDGTKIFCYQLVNDVQKIRDAFPVLADKNPELIMRMELKRGAET